MDKKPGPKFNLRKPVWHSNSAERSWVVLQSLYRSLDLSVEMSIEAYLVVARGELSESSSGQIGYQSYKFFTNWQSPSQGRVLLSSSRLEVRDHGHRRSLCGHRWRFGFGDVRERLWPNTWLWKNCCRDGFSGSVILPACIFLFWCQVLNFYPPPAGQQFG